jgi:hypothetical protein
MRNYDLLLEGSRSVAYPLWIKEPPLSIEFLRDIF